MFVIIKQEFCSPERYNDSDLFEPQLRSDGAQARKARFRPFVVDDFAPIFPGTGAENAWPQHSKLKYTHNISSSASEVGQSHETKNQ